MFFIGQLAETDASIQSKARKATHVIIAKPTHFRLYMEAKMKTSLERFGWGVNFEHRNVIRNTWGNPGMDIPSIKVVFLLGTTNKFQKEIIKENEIHRDIIQGNFLDSYRNLTYKHTMGLSWASSFCNGTKYLMKMDDDIFVDIYQFFDYIANRVRILDLRNNVVCYFQTGMPVVRDPVSKWYVSKKEFKPDTFNNIVQDGHI
ncbi:lactosylceramide 1,3-N-acetyl-beta-D-glucosaminyltransferase [Trichonephila inaurata madagascariensis]|uniref:Hexosyltransferase n=1 Tax=Trichonephila inaurata madagascariensis TaxID=2747483 RepID=A0A8X6MD21_9ARAC|nr:lactosylceramide 1,3-N-acetyl-beta-D-glucosaminyltransferase [Trichonephila inaurata madagascariensis]